MTRIQFKRGSTQDWETANPVLLEGTPGYDTTTGAFKVGDGNTAWADLGTVGGDAAAAEIAALTERITALETTLADYSRANDTKVQAVTNNMQGMLDVYAEQPGGSLRNFEDFYKGLKQFLSSAAGIDTAAILSAVEEILDVQLPARDQTIADLTEYLVTTVPTRDDVSGSISLANSALMRDLMGWVNATFATAAGLQELMDSIKGPDATPQIIKEMFWILNELLERVMEILGLEVNELGQVIGATGPIESSIEGKLQALLPGIINTVEDNFRALTTGGTIVPKDVDWTPCTRKLGSGNIEARLVNGVVQMRGNLKHTVTAVGSYVEVLQLPANFPLPDYGFSQVLFCVNTNVAYRLGAVRIDWNGSVGLSAPTGQFDFANFDTVTYKVY